MRRTIALLFAGLIGSPANGAAQAVWQADLRIRDISASGVDGGLRLQVVVAAELGEAMAARVEIFLPVGVGLKEMAPGCVPGPNPQGVSDLQARVICRLGDLPPRSSREMHVVTTAPPPGIPSRFGAVALSDTPDPRPGNNFAERELPSP
ncbi:MAG TPA: hypothetical protein VFO06_00980 [Gemmatimonadales bacterium]|nr:hypothetical protein [Gemmatimonadales bacterium]